MDREQWRVLEIIAFLGVYAVAYLAVIGPFLGSVLPGFESAAFSGPNNRPSGELPDTGRGWLLIVFGVPTLLGYLYLRARLAGQTMQQLWGQSD